MEEFEERTGKHAIYGGKITKQFKKWKEKKREEDEEGEEEEEESEEDFWETRILFDTFEVYGDEKVVIKPRGNELKDEEKSILIKKGFEERGDGGFISLFDDKKEASNVVEEIKEWYKFNEANLN